MGAIEDLARGSRPSGATPAIMRGTIVDIRTDGLVSVTIPRYMSTEVIGPMRTAVPDLDPGDQVLVGTVGGSSDRMVISLADGTQNWLGQPDLTVVPDVGADMDLFKDKGVAMVSDAAALAGDNFPTDIGGMAEAWARSTGQKFQRYTDRDGKVYLRSKTGADPWTAWQAAAVSAADIADASTVGMDIITATDTLAARAALALSNVDNTADAVKPVSTPQLVELNKKADANNPRFTGDVTGISKVHVGLDRVDNTADVEKPISLPTLARFAKVDEDIAAISGGTAAEPAITAGTTAQYWRGDKTWQTLNKAAVGLASVDDTSDANKPVSTAQQTALNGKAATVHTHAAADVTTGTLDPNRLPAATITAQGALSAVDKTKLDNATSSNIASRLVIRDAAGRAQFADPFSAQDAATKASSEALEARHRLRRMEWRNQGFAVSGGQSWDVGPLSLNSTSTGRNVGSTFATSSGAPSGAILIQETGFYVFDCMTVVSSGDPGGAWLRIVLTRPGGSGFQEILCQAPNLSLAGSFSIEYECHVSTPVPIYCLANDEIRFTYLSQQNHTVTCHVRALKCGTLAAWGM